MNEELQGQMKDLGDEVSPDALPPSIASTGVDKSIPVKRQGNKYVKLISKANEDAGTPDLWVDISNFSLDLIRDEVDVDHPENQSDLQRCIRLTSDEAGKWQGVVKAGDISNIRDFENLLVSKGDFLWYGDAKEFKRIWHMATQEGRESRMRVLLKSIAGYEPATGTFLVGNGAIDKTGKVYLKDDEAIINVNGVAYRLLPKDKDAGGMPLFDFEYGAEDAAKDFAELLRITEKLWGKSVELLWGWGITHLFRERWWNEYKNFPLCMMPAPPGTGKNALMSLFVKLFGLPFEPAPVKGMTPTGLFNRVNSYCNIPVWVDEWKNNVSDQLSEMFKSNADGSVKLVGTLDEFKTKSRKHRTGCLITGEFRAIDTALNQRYIMVVLKKKEDSALLEKARVHAGHLSAFTVKMLREYDQNWKNINDVYRAKVKAWSGKLEGKVDIRIVENYAKVYAALQNVDGSGPDADAREERFMFYMQEKVSESGNMNPALEALKFMPRYITGTVGRKGWVPFYVDLKRKKFGISPEELIRVYCDYSKQGTISTDDLFRYGQEAGIIHPQHVSPKLQSISLKMSMGAKTLGRKGWLLNMDNELVRDIAEELAPLCDKQATVKEEFDNDAPKF